MSQKPTTPTPGNGLGGTFTPSGFVPNKPKVAAPPNQAPYKPGRSPAQESTRAAQRAGVVQVVPVHHEAHAQASAATMATQRMLNAHGAHLAVDGQWGPATESAYQAYLHNAAVQHKANAPLDATQDPLRVHYPTRGEIAHLSTPQGKAETYTQRLRDAGFTHQSVDLAGQVAHDVKTGKVSDATARAALAQLMTPAPEGQTTRDIWNLTGGQALGIGGMVGGWGVGAAQGLIGMAPHQIGQQAEEQLPGLREATPGNPAADVANLAKGTYQFPLQAIEHPGRSIVNDLAVASMAVDPLMRLGAGVRFANTALGVRLSDQAMAAGMERARVQPIDSPLRAEIQAAYSATGMSPENVHAAMELYDATTYAAAEHTGLDPRQVYARAWEGARYDAAHPELAGDIPEDVHAQMDEVHNIPPEKQARNIRAMAKETPENMLPQHDVVSREGHRVLGRVTFDEWMKRLQATTPSIEQQKIDATFYERLEPVFKRVFGDGYMPVLRAFSASQANAGTKEGLASVLRAAERIERGSPIQTEEGGIGSVVADAIEQAYHGTILKKGQAAKLSDFIDSIRGLKTREWMGHDQAGLEPAAGDVWSSRDVGYLDRKLVGKGTRGRAVSTHNFIVERHGVDLRQHEPDIPNAPSGSRYNHITRFYNDVANRLNAISYHGRQDWSAAQAQALGWANIQRFYGRFSQEGIDGWVDRGIAQARKGLRRDRIREANRHIATPSEDTVVSPTDSSVVHITSEAEPYPDLHPQEHADYAKMSPENRVAYARAVDRAMEAGHFKSILGLEDKGSHYGVGVWRGAENPGLGSHVGAPEELTPELRAKYNALAAAQGIAKEQGSVSWGRPLAPTATGDDVFPALLLNREASGALGAAVDRAFGDGNIGVIHGPQGVSYLVDFTGDGHNLQGFAPDGTAIKWQGGYTHDERLPEMGMEGIPTFQEAIGAVPEGDTLKNAVEHVNSVVKHVQDHYFNAEGRSAVSLYNNLLLRHQEKIGADIGNRGLTPGQKEHAEAVLGAWADRNPDDPYAQQFNDLQEAAHNARQSKDPTWLFEDSGGLFGSMQRAQGNSRMLYQRDEGERSFGEEARHELEIHAALARDIARTLPEDEWPQWVKNQIREQAVGPVEPVRWPDEQAPNDASELTLPEFGRALHEDVAKRVQDEQSKVAGMGHLFDKGDVVQSKGGRTFEILGRRDVRGEPGYMVRDTESDAQYTIPESAVELLSDDDIGELLRQGFRGHDSFKDWAGMDRPLREVLSTYRDAAVDTPRLVAGDVREHAAFAKAGAKGAVRRFSDLRHRLYTGPKTDLSTAVHELFHAMAQFIKIPEGMTEEQAARAWETYVAKGVAPHPKLQPLFDTLSKGMIEVYGDVRNIPEGHLSPEFESQLKEFFSRQGDKKWDVRDADGLDETYWHSGGKTTAAKTESLMNTGGAPAFHLNVHDPETGELVASQHGLINPTDNSLYAASVYTTPEYRGRGISSLLHGKVMDFAEAHGIPASAVFKDRDLAERTMRQAEARGRDVSEKGGVTYFQNDEPSHWEEGALKAADEAGIDIADVKGTGEGGRVTMKDVDDHRFALLSPAAQIREIGPGLKVLRGKIEKGYSVERGQRFAEVRSIFNDERMEPVDRHYAAMNALKGVLPTIEYKGHTRLTDEAIAQLVQDAQNSKTLREGQAIRASEAVLELGMGKVPTRSELILFEHIWGKDIRNAFEELGNMPRDFKEIALQVMNVPRSLMASYDFSAPFRQGLVIASRHPDIFFDNFKEMMKAWRSEDYKQMIDSNIASDPNLPLAQAGGLAVGSHEEPFRRAALAEEIPLVGIGVKASDRAYTAFLEKTRMDVFNRLLSEAQAGGRYWWGKKYSPVDIQDEAFLKSLCEYINSATGRGGGGAKFEAIAPTLSDIFFSPRLMKSRLNFLNPKWYMKQDPFVRQEAMRSFLQLGGTAATFVALASQIPGVTVELDPRNPDWGKIKFANGTRFDVGGGFQQYLRLAAQLVTETAISSTTGKSSALNSGGFGKSSDWDILVKFFQGKFAPIPSIIADRLKGSTQTGQKFNVGQEVWSHMIPLAAQDAVDLYRHPIAGLNGWEAALAGYGIESVGFGMQTYQGRVNTASRDKYQALAKKVGMTIPQPILDRFAHASQLTSIRNSNKGDPRAAADAAIDYYSKTTGRQNFDRFKGHYGSDAQAKNILSIITAQMVGPSVAAYKRVIDQKATARHVK